jgi:hypothetical protein
MNNKGLYQKGYDKGVKHGILFATIVVTALFVVTLLLTI